MEGKMKKVVLILLALTVCFAVSVGTANASGSISGTVLTAKGEAAPGMMVTITQIDRSRNLIPIVVRAETGFDGKFAIQNLAPGGYVVKALQGNCLASRYVNVIEGQPANVMCKFCPNCGCNKEPGMKNAGVVLKDKLMKNCPCKAGEPGDKPGGGGGCGCGGK